MEVSGQGHAVSALYPRGTYMQLKLKIQKEELRNLYSSLNIISIILLRILFDWINGWVAFKEKVRAGLQGKANFHNSNTLCSLTKFYASVT
jgi:hypothetical protein